MTDTTKENTQPEEQATAQDPAQDQGADLNLQDLSAMKSIIDVASSRGAFKPSEMMMVGQVYNKLSTFLDAVAKQSAAQQPKGA
jgi:hypothetical protein